MLTGEREYCVFINGRPVRDAEYQGMVQDNPDFPLRLAWDEQPVPPPIARDNAASLASGNLLYFFDDHCIPLRWYFAHPPKNGELIHAAYSANLGKDFYYHSLVDGMRGDYRRTPLDVVKYPCVSGPHGGMAVTTDTWNAIGGYGDFWQGFGGEEVYLDKKAASKGVQVMCEPRMRYLHFSCRERGYPKDFNRQNFIEAERRL